MLFLVAVDVPADSQPRIARRDGTNHAIGVQWFKYVDRVDGHPPREVPGVDRPLAVDLVEAFVEPLDPVQLALGTGPDRRHERVAGRCRGVEDPDLPALTP